MKKSIHPPYQDVLFIDSSTGKKFVIGSTMQPKETEEYEGKTYPAVRVPVSSASHPFYTGSEKFIDSEGRVSRFAKRYAKKREEEKRNKEQSEQAFKEQAKQKKKKK
ncbi:MAG: type B 50S ribosomal protein L31 [Chlamydiota bacterium]